MAKKTPEPAQLVLIQRLKETLPANISLVDALADLLELSNDSAYRRIRGETALSIEEIAAICRHFRFSFDSFVNSQDDSIATFKYNKMEGESGSFKAYFKNIRSDLEKIMQFGDKEVIFAAEDIPVFHHFVSPELTAFKMFYWNKSILNAKDFEDKKYDAALIDNELLETAAAIYDMYAKVPSKEIWSDDTANSTLKQIEFYWEAGIFKTKEDALRICDEVSAMLDRIKRQAELNVKLGADEKPTSAESNYALYHSDVMIGNNCVLVNTAGLKATYLSYHTFNTIYTANPAFCNETELWLKNLVRKSNLISGVAEKQRYRYFKKIEDLMRKLREKIGSE